MTDLLSRSYLVPFFAAAGIALVSIAPGSAVKAGGLGEVMISRTVPYCDTNPNDVARLRQIQQLPNFQQVFGGLRDNCPDIALALTDLPTATIRQAAPPVTRGRDGQNPVPPIRVTNPTPVTPGTPDTPPGEEPPKETPPDAEPPKVTPPDTTCASCTTFEDGSPVPHGKTREQYENYLRENGGVDPWL